METSREKYDQFYKERGFPDRPVEVLDSVLKFKNEGDALDLGAGDGRNSIFLALHGFNVRAVDFSATGIEKLMKRAQEKDLSVQAEVKDLKEFDWNKDYDVLVCTYVLHLMPHEEALKLVRMMQQHTKPGGLNVLALMTKHGDFFRNNPNTNTYYPDINEAEQLYEQDTDWEIVEHAVGEVDAASKKPDNTPMINTATRFIARKKHQ